MVNIVQAEALAAQPTRIYYLLLLYTSITAQNERSLIKNTKIETRKGCFQTPINIYQWKSRKTKKEEKAAPKGKLHCTVQ